MGEAGEEDHSSVRMCIRYCFPGPGIRAAEAGLQSFTTTGIFVLSGLALRRGEALRALTAWDAILFGVASILLVTPLAALAVLRLPLGTPELGFGLAVFCCMPTTLSSGVSLTQVRCSSACVSSASCQHALCCCQALLTSNAGAPDVRSFIPLSMNFGDAVSQVGSTAERLVSLHCTTTVVSGCLDSS
jgi:hypothetical protein